MTGRLSYYEFSEYKNRPYNFFGNIFRGPYKYTPRDMQIKMGDSTNISDIKTENKKNIFKEIL